jgi:hypothetical protein
MFIFIGVPKKIIVGKIFPVSLLHLKISERISVLSEFGGQFP